MKHYLTRITTALLTLATAFFVSQSAALATGSDYSSTPNINTILYKLKPCPNPGGTLIAGYDTGMHQIPGGGLHSGSDYVYKVGDKIFIQCFCPDKDSGKTKGIQSLWVHESHLSPANEQHFLNLGWLKIENGAQWGLPDGTYFVKNTHFYCHVHDNNCPPSHKDKEDKADDHKKHEEKAKHADDKDEKKYESKKDEKRDEKAYRHEDKDEKKYESSNSKRDEKTAYDQKKDDQDYKDNHTASKFPPSRYLSNHNQMNHTGFNSNHLSYSYNQ